MRNYLLAAVAAISVCAPAAAEVLVLDATISTLAANQTSTVKFAQFDSSLGKLTSVTLSFEAASSTKVDFSNSSNMSRTYTVQRTASTGLTGNGFSLSDVYAPGDDTFVLGARINPATPRTGTKTYAADFADSDTLTSNFAAFIGNGTVDFSFARFASFSGSPGQVTVSPTQIGGKATLSYNYELAAVPEPATWAMMIGGFALTGFASRRRSRTTVTYA